MSAAVRLFIADASVLIDYLETDRSILSLAGSRLGTIHVPDLLLEHELPDLDADECGRLGIVIEAVSLDLLQRAADHRRAGLSVQDRVCLLMAKEHKATCLTSDARLYDACAEEGVDAWRTLRVLIELHKAGALDAGKAFDIAREIQRVNPGYITAAILAELKRQLAG